MRQDVRHPRQRFPISAIHHTADAAHLVLNLSLLSCPRFELVNFRLVMKKLYALQTAINQTRNAIQESQRENIFVEEKQDGRTADCEESLTQPTATLGLRPEQLAGQASVISLARHPSPPFPIHL